MMKTIKISRYRAALAALVLALAPAAMAQDASFETLGGGVKARTLAQGHGVQASEGMIATVHVIGWLDEGGARGKELYNSRREGQPISFVIGTNGVMPAWNEGVKGMRPGARRMLLIPSAMGYGKKGVEGQVPSNAPLMFQIELVSLDADNA